MIWKEPNGVRHENCAVFFRVAEEFGGLSNMHNSFPLRVGRVRISSSEALYQACRFPSHPDIQKEILDARHAMGAKMKSKKDGRRERLSRSDWDQVRVDVMRWCLAVKLACNCREFGGLLLSTDSRPIIERSRRDPFWGAKLEGEVLVGQNVLGKLLMELREKVRQSQDQEALKTVAPLGIADFRLFDQEIGNVDLRPERPCQRRQDGWEYLAPPHRAWRG